MFEQLTCWWGDIELRPYGVLGNWPHVDTHFGLLPSLGLCVNKILSI